MDKHQDIHNTIRRVMKVRYRGRKVLPFMSSKRYGRSLLPSLFAELGFNLGAEIGVQKGKYSEQLCKGNPNLTLYSIDPWKSYNSISQGTHDARFNETVERLKPYNAKIIRKTSMDALQSFKDGSLDFVYIDGNHAYDYVCMDIIHWSKKVKSGGIVACHDYHDAQVGRAIDGYVYCHVINPWYMLQEAQSTAYWVKP